MHTIGRCSFSSTCIAAVRNSSSQLQYIHRRQLGERAQNSSCSFASSATEDAPRPRLQTFARPHQAPLRIEAGFYHHHPQSRGTNTPPRQPRAFQSPAPPTYQLGPRLHRILPSPPQRQHSASTQRQQRNRPTTIYCLPRDFETRQGLGCFGYEHSRVRMKHHSASKPAFTITIRKAEG
jgi:hypothetical protein